MTRQVHYRIYDPLLGKWQAGSAVPKKNVNLSLWKVDPVYSFSINSGVVAWEFKQDYAPNELVCVIYDPVQGKWVLNRVTDEERWWYPEVKNQDGVVAYIAADDAGTISYWGKVCYRIYDPYLGAWWGGDSGSGQSILKDTLSIGQGTVWWVQRLDTGSQIHSRGYDPYWGGWYDGPTKPMAAFTATPTLGKPPLRVWFWDSSIAWAGYNWIWNFGDGSNPTTARTIYHDFPGGDYEVTLLVGIPAEGIATTARQIIAVTDTAPPTGQIRINNGAAYANSRLVTLNLSAWDNGSVKSMQFSNDLQSWSNWETFAGTRTWTLTPGDCVKTVGVRFKDAADNISSVYSASIALDTKPPTDCSLAINAGASATRTTLVALDLAAADDGPLQVSVGVEQSFWGFWSIHWEPWEPLSVYKLWTLAEGEGIKKVFARFVDAAGNISETVSDTILLDITAPAEESVKINGGSALYRPTGLRYINSNQVNLALYATGSTKMQFSRTGGTGRLDWTYWETYVPTKLWTLDSAATPANGLKTVYARFQDDAGNTTEMVSDSIYLDMSAPAGGALTATPGPEQVTLNWSDFADSGGSGIGYYMLFYSSTGFPDKTTGAKLYQGGSTSFPHVELTPGETCYYRVYAVDRAGNVSTGTVTAKATPYSSKKVISPALFLLLN